MDGWSRVIAAVVDRRAELGWTQKELATAAKVSERTIQNLEAGSRPQARNRSRIEAALGWDNGAMRRIEEEKVADRSPPPPPRLSDATRQAMHEELGPELAARLIAEADHASSGRTSPAAGEGDHPQGSGGRSRRSAG